ncbi:hypothetical protein QTP88_015965 [Uroleucon formosanum]
MWIWDSTSEAQENYNITILPDHKGLYYESHGMIQTSHTTWNLVTYVDIKVLTTNYDKLMTQYIEMETICKQMITNFCNAEIENICNQFLHQFATTTRPYLYEIQINRHNAMLSIEHNSNNKIRNRRGLGGTFKHLINVLYGAYSKIDTEFIFKQILELTKNKIQNINLVKEKTRVVQAEILDANHTLQEITEHHQKFENNLRYLQGLTKESIVNINRLELKNKLLEQAFLFEVILNQYAYETQNLIAIINAALDGKIHTSVITPRKLIQELTEIKISLPMGNSLPIELIPESMPNLFKISEKTIFVQDEYLIFSIEIPLVASKVFNVYRLIPLPILYSTNTVILIEPEVEYLVINNDNEEFFTITGKQWEAYVNLGTYKLCKGGQTFHRRSRSNLCEVALLAYQTIPETCKIKLVTLTTPIWDKLMDSNAWLFYTQPTLVTIKNIKLPSDVKEIAELNFGILFSLELPNKLTKEEFTQKSLEEKIELLLNQSEDDNDSDPDFIPKPFNIEQRSPVITRSKKRDTELVDPNNINDRLETFNMSKPIFFKPEFYSGEPDECVNDFIENYNLISAANEWSDDKKIMYAPIYLKKSAKAFYQNYIISNPTPSWSHFELALKEYFMSPGRARMLKAKLTNRKLKLNETVSQFLADFQFCTENVDEVPIPGVRLEVMGHINNIETSFILDSGATISVINSEQVIKSSNSLIETKNIRVHTANGSILKVIGKMEIDIAFKNLIFPTQFVLVSNLAGPALLGTDFLSKYRVQLDFFNKEIVIYKNITNKITFTFKPKRDVLSSCTIVEDSVKQNEQSKETHENKIEINIDNNSENDVNLSGQNENIILLEKLAKQINDTDKKFPPFHQIKPKINKLEINNVTLYETKKYIESDKINDTYELLNKSIISLASKFVKLENVPSDGNCGVHALVKILNNEQINVNFKQITDLLKITKYKTPIWLEAEDLAAVINHYNLNLIVIQETLTSDNNSTVLA